MRFAGRVIGRLEADEMIAQVMAFEHIDEAPAPLAGRHRQQAIGGGQRVQGRPCALVKRVDAGRGDHLGVVAVLIGGDNRLDPRARQGGRAHPAAGATGPRQLGHQVWGARAGGEPVGRRGRRPAADLHLLLPRRRPRRRARRARRARRCCRPAGRRVSPATSDASRARGRSTASPPLRKKTMALTNPEAYKGLKKPDMELMSLDDHMKQKRVVSRHFKKKRQSNSMYRLHMQNLKEKNVDLLLP